MGAVRFWDFLRNGATGALGAIIGTLGAVGALELLVYVLCTTGALLFGPTLLALAIIDNGYVGIGVWVGGLGTLSIAWSVYDLLKNGTRWVSGLLICSWLITGSALVVVRLVKYAAQ